MRKVIITNIVSLDGFYEGPGGNVMALPMDHGFDSYNLERHRAADTLLLGRSTYEEFKGFWPGVADDPEAAAEQLGIPVEHLDTPTNREISRLENAIEKVVVSDGLATDQTDPWRDTTRIVRRADAHERIAELKRGSGGDIVVFGSRTLWNDLLAAGLVDELHLVVGAVVLGDGTPAFAAPPAAALRLLDAGTFDGSDNVLVRYANEAVRRRGHRSNDHVRRAPREGAAWTGGGSHGPSTCPLRMRRDDRIRGARAVARLGRRASRGLRRRSADGSTRRRDVRRLDRRLHARGRGARLRGRRHQLGGRRIRRHRDECEDRRPDAGRARAAHEPRHERRHRGPR